VNAFVGTFALVPLLEQFSWKTHLKPVWLWKSNMETKSTGDDIY